MGTKGKEDKEGKVNLSFVEVALNGKTKEPIFILSKREEFQI